MRDTKTATDLLKPFDARFMSCYPVSTRVNQVAHDDEECCQPADPQPFLFSLPTA